MATSKTQRWLDLLAVLVGRRFPLSADELMERIPAYREKWVKGDETARATVRRMFERDKDELRRLGIPLETRRFRVEGHAEEEGYLIPKGDFYLPYLQLLRSDDAEEASGAGRPGALPPPGSHSVGRVTVSEDDARTAILALREVLTLPSFPFAFEARSALRKLTFDLDPALARAPGSGLGSPSRVRILDRPGGADPEGVLGVLLDALHDRRRVRFRYHSIGRDAVDDREVEPWGLLFQWGAWYLAARDPGKEAEGEEDPDTRAARLFRVDRMAGAHLARPGANGPDFEVPPAFDVRAYAGRQAWELEEEDGAELEVVVRFLPPLSFLAERNGWGEPASEPEGTEQEEDAAGTRLRRFQVGRLDPFLRWILSLAGEAEIVSPPAARSGLSRLAANVAGLYRERR